MTRFGRQLLRRAFPVALLVMTAGLGAGCGYTLQGSHSPLLEKEGVSRVYVKPLVNNTYKVGVENVVYNALIRTLSVHRRVRLVTSPDSADAVLSGSINVAEFSSAGATTGNLLPPAGLPVAERFSNIAVSTSYNAVLVCAFELKRTHIPRGKRETLWASSFSRAKPFPGSNQLDVPGTTSALINESEFDRALSDLATSMMDDVHESMLAMF